MLSQIPNTSSKILITMFQISNIRRQSVYPLSALGINKNHHQKFSVNENPKIISKINWGISRSCETLNSQFGTLYVYLCKYMQAFRPQKESSNQIIRFDEDHVMNQHWKQILTSGRAETNHDISSCLTSSIFHLVIEREKVPLAKNNFGSFESGGHTFKQLYVYD